MKIKSADLKTTIVGGVPQPTGGVTGYVYRLTHHLRTHIDCVIDLYPHREKWTIIPTTLYARQLEKRSFFIWAFRAVNALIASRQIYFNFSSSRFLAIAALIPKITGQIWVITLHHGDLAGKKRISKLALIGLRKMDKIGFIGNKQKHFYLENGFPNDRLFPVMPYLPYVAPPLAFASIDTALNNRLMQIRKTHKKLLLASGYPTSIYRHEWSIEYMQKLRSNSEVGLILCLYGGDTNENWAEIKKAAKDNPNIYFFEHLQPDAFQLVLQTADIYLRPNSVDSYGISVAEAISLGKIAVASDACDRFPGAELFPADDKDRFFSLIDISLSENTTRPKINSELSIKLAQQLLHSS